MSARPQDLAKRYRRIAELNRKAYAIHSGIEREFSGMSSHPEEARHRRLAQERLVESCDYENAAVMLETIS